MLNAVSSCPLTLAVICTDALAPPCFLTSPGSSLKLFVMHFNKTHLFGVVDGDVGAGVPDAGVSALLAGREVLGEDGADALALGGADVSAVEALAAGVSGGAGVEDEALGAVAVRSSL